MDLLPISRLPRQNSSRVTPVTPSELPTIGGYEIVGLLGTGGMAQVLLGRQTGPNGFERPVVIKRILPHLVRRQSFVDMFLDEARTIANIRHPNVVSIHDFRFEDGELFMVMEYLEGETAASLRRRLNARGERMPGALWCHIFAETCAGLYAAHQATNELGLPLNLVHRDVSPPNILVTYDGAVKLIDFGIAKSDHRSSQTDAGHIKGKYAYMSPEQAQGRPLDARSDLFSLGVVMFEMTTGRRLFKRDTDLLTVQAVCDDPIPEPSEAWPDYTPELHRICLRALARDPTERYQSAVELRRDLLAVVRADASAPLPEEVIGLFMQDMFEDRIDLKRGLLQRVRRGEQFESFSSPTDSVIAISTLMTSALPKPMLDDGAAHGTGAPPRSVESSTSGRSQSHSHSIAIIFYAAASAVVVLLLTMVQRPGPAPAPVAAPPPPPPPVVVAPPPEPPAQVALEIDSEPTGAEVSLGEQVIGETPMTIDWPKGDEPLELKMTLAGYANWSTTVTPTRDVLVKGHLSRKRRRSRRRRIRRPESPRQTEAAATNNPPPSSGAAATGPRPQPTPAAAVQKEPAATKPVAEAAASPLRSGEPDAARVPSERAAPAEPPVPSSPPVQDASPQAPTPSEPGARQADDGPDTETERPAAAPDDPPQPSPPSVNGSTGGDEAPSETANDARPAPEPEPKKKATEANGDASDNGASDSSGSDSSGSDSDGQDWPLSNAHSL